MEKFNKHNLGKKGQATTTIISVDAEFRGELKLENNLQIDGQCEGLVSLRHGVLTISKTGFYSGKMRVKKLFCNGIIDGEILAETAEILSNATITGLIKSNNLIIHHGAKISCAIKMGK